MKSMREKIEPFLQDFGIWTRAGKIEQIEKIYTESHEEYVKELRERARSMGSGIEASPKDFGSYYGGYNDALKGFLALLDTPKATPGDAP